jgi:hypothetical protein
LDAAADRVFRQARALYERCPRSRVGAVRRAADEFRRRRRPHLREAINRRRKKMSLSDAQVRATVAVSDITRAAAFYEGTPGLSPLTTSARCCAERSPVTN